MRSIRHVSLGAALLLVGLLANPVASLAAEKAKGPEISRSIAKEMTAAQKAMQAGQWNEALKNLEAAEQRISDPKAGLTAFDKKTIYEFKGFCYVKTNNMKAAETAYEASLATGAASSEDSLHDNQILFRLAGANQQYAKAIEYGKQVADAGLAKSDDLGIMSQLYYLQKDCKDSAIWSDKAIAQAKKAGEPVKENWLQFKLQCASDAQDNAAISASLVDLIRLTNKTNYWNSLTRIERQDERDDHNTLMIYRVMFDTNSMNADTDYIEMAQLLADAGLPGEAVMVLDKLQSTPGMLKDEHKERTGRLQAALKARADADQKSIAQQDAEAQKNAAGELSVKTGEVHYGLGDYPGAETVIAAGVQKGQVKHLDEAYVYEGRAYAAQKNYPEAKKAFGQLKTVPNMSPRVLKLWDLYAEKLGTPISG